MVVGLAHLLGSGPECQARRVSNTQAVTLQVCLSPFHPPTQPQLPPTVSPITWAIQQKTIGGSGQNGCECVDVTATSDRLPLGSPITWWQKLKGNGAPIAWLTWSATLPASLGLPPCG